MILCFPTLERADIREEYFIEKVRVLFHKTSKKFVKFNASLMNESDDSSVHSQESTSSQQ